MKINKLILNHFRKEYVSFISKEENNQTNKNIDLMKLIYFDLSILILEIFSLKKKIVKKKKIVLPRIKILNKLPKAKGNFFYQINRYIKKIFDTGNFYKPKLFINLENPLTFSPSDLLISYQEKRNKNCFTSNLSEWYEKKKNCIKEDDKNISESIKVIFENSLIKFKKKNSKKLSSIFYFNCIFLTSWFRQHKETIEKKKTPREFWSGTMGNPFNRIFAYIVRKNKGKVTIFDHGTGSGFYNTIEDSLIELDWADTFVTFGPSMAKGMKNNACMNKSLRLNRNNVTKFVWVPTKSQSKIKRKKFSNVDIVYVLTEHIENKANIIDSYSDKFMISFQRKIIKELIDKKINFALKPHPSSSNKIIKKLSKGLKIKIIKSDFNDILWKKEILVFDTPHTSAFKDALRIGVPIILFNFPRIKFHDKAFNLLKKRCKVINIDVNFKKDIESKKFIFNKSLKDSIKLVSNKLFIKEYFPTKNNIF